MNVNIQDKSFEIRPKDAADRAYLEKLGATEQGKTVTFVRQDCVKGYGKDEQFHLRIDMDDPA